MQLRTSRISAGHGSSELPTAELDSERADAELEATLQRLPPGSRHAGVYSYCETSSVATGHGDLHNQTMTLTTLFEVSG